MASLTVISSPAATSAATTYLLTMTTTAQAPAGGDADAAGSPPAKLAPARTKSGAPRRSRAPPPPRGPSVARRNERERNRVRQVNLGFATLRQHVPNRSKKMSKVETLRSAVQYIRQLRALLGEEPSAADDDSSSCGGGGGADENRCGGAVPGFAEAFARPAQRGSPAPSLGSDASSPYDSLSPEDEELMDFASWLS